MSTVKPPTKLTEPEFEPLPDNEPLSPAKIAWCEGEIIRTCGLKGTRICVIMHAMDITPQPTNPECSVAHGRVRRHKFHDKEPAAVNANILEKYPDYWKDYPTKSGPLSTEAQWAELGAIVKHYLCGGVTSYGKDGLRKDKRKHTAVNPDWDAADSL